eukprot:6479205-Amphidinium_carterae.3
MQSPSERQGSNSKVSAFFSTFCKSHNSELPVNRKVRWIILRYTGHRAKPLDCEALDPALSRISSCTAPRHRHGHGRHGTAPQFTTSLPKHGSVYKQATRIAELNHMACSKAIDNRQTTSQRSFSTSFKDLTAQK